MNSKKEKIYFFGLVIWFLAALFYLYEFFLRVFISTIADDVMRQLHLNAQTFSIMGAAYFLVYSLMQVPVGLLADKYGARCLLTIATCLAALGAIWFSFSVGFWNAFCSRSFMGFGSSFGYVCLLVLALNWFPRKHFGFVVGVTNFLGALGPFLAGGPLAFLLKIFDNDWRLILGGIGIVGLILAFLIGGFVRNCPKRGEREIIYLDPYKEPIKDRLLLLFGNSQAWYVVLYSGIVYVCLPLLGAYWGTAYLQSRGLDRTIAATVASFIWIGMALGSLLTGRISDKIKRRNPILYVCAFVGVLASGAAVYWPVTNAYLFAVLFFCIGIASSGNSLTYAIISEHVPKKLHATALGFNNSTVMLLGALIPPVISFFIERSARAHQNIASVFYTLHDFRSGLFFMPLLYLIAFLIAFLFIKETFCRQQADVIKVEIPKEDHNF